MKVEALSSEHACFAESKLTDSRKKSAFFDIAMLSAHVGGAENDGHEIAGHENDGPNSRA